MLVDRINIVKISILPIFKEIFMKILTQFFTDNTKLDFYKETRNTTGKRHIQ